MMINIITTDSPEYQQMINLRMEVLLDPIGIPKSYIDTAKESKDILIVAVEDNKIVGCCILTVIDKFTLQLRQMAVKQNIQGTGTGAAIVAYAEKQAKKMGYKSLMMNARDSVIPFYEKQGYVIDGVGFTEVNIPHHKMKKEL